MSQLAAEQAANRVAAYLRERRGLNGIDPHQVHVVNGYVLFVEDLWELVRAGRALAAPRHLAPEPAFPTMVGDVVHLSVPEGGERFQERDYGRCVPAVVQRCHENVQRVDLAAFNGGEISMVIASFLHRGDDPRPGSWHPKSECPRR